MERIFSTTQRIKILQAIIFKTEILSVNNIASKLKLSKGLVSKYFDILLKAGILKKIKVKFSITNSPLIKGIRILLNIRNINSKMFKKYSFITSVGLYGSCANGENTEDSDIDLWIKIDSVNEKELAPLTSELNKKIKNGKPLFLTNKKMEKIKQEDPLFYHSLVFGSIILCGGKDGIWI